MDKMFHGKINDAMADRKLDYTKLNRCKMLFHSMWPKKYKDKLKSK